MSLSGIVIALAVLAGNGNYVWPLDLKPELTSSFAEYRPGRFHAGIDLRTNGIGRDVRAIEDGYVSRIRCSPWGYGKAIYLQLKDGNTVVYGHLDDYYDELRAYVRAAQHQKESYTVDLHPKAGQFPVKRGDIIAKSGQTGIGAPHLHFELRNASQEPINPRHVGYTWPDTAKPVLKQLLVTPADAQSTVEGDLLPKTYALQAIGNGAYRSPTVQATGRIGLSLDSLDPGSGGYRLGVHTLRVTQNGQEIFRIAHDKLSYDNHRNGAVAYHPYFREEGRFLNLWRWPGNVCDIYAQSPGQGWITVPDGASTLQVEAIDFFDRKSTLEIPVESTRPAIASTTPTGSQQGRGELSCAGEMLILTARFTGAESEAPELILGGKANATSPGFIQVNDRTWRAAITPTRTGDLGILVEHPRMAPYEKRLGAWVRGSGGSFTDDDLTVMVPDDAPYGTAFMDIRGAVGLSGSGGLRPYGSAYGLWPDDMPLNASVTVSMPYPEGIPNAQRLHVYRKTWNGWSREDSRKEGNRLVFKTNKLGTYMALEDSTPPSISQVSPPQGYQTKTRRPLIHATVADNASGIAHIDVRCGDQWLLTSYDPERRKIEWERDEDLPSGPQTITLRLTDKAGNVETTTRTITVAQ